MPSSNHRSASSSIARSSRRIQPVRQIQVSRSSSVPPSRQFIIILTNNREMLQQTSTFRLRITPPIPTPVPPILNNSNQTGTAVNNNQNHNDREQILHNLLRAELSEVARDYLSRTRRAFPVHYIFDMSDIESQQQP